MFVCVSITATVYSVSEFPHLRLRSRLFLHAHETCLGEQSLYSVGERPALTLTISGIAFTVLDTPGHIPSQVAGHPWGRPLSGSKPPWGHTQVMPPTPTPNQVYLTPGSLPSRPFYRMLPSLGPGPQQLLLHGLCLSDHLSMPWLPCLDTHVLPPSWLQH